MKTKFKIHIVLILISASWLMIDDALLFKIGAIGNQIEQGNQLSDQSHHINAANFLHYFSIKKLCTLFAGNNIIIIHITNVNTSPQAYFFNVWQPPESVIA